MSDETKPRRVRARKPRSAREECDCGSPTDLSCVHGGLAVCRTCYDLFARGPRKPRAASAEPAPKAPLKRPHRYRAPKPGTARANHPSLGGGR